MSKLVRFVSVASLGLLLAFAAASCRTAPASSAAEPSSGTLQSAASPAPASQSSTPPDQPSAATEAATPPAQVPADATPAAQPPVAAAATPPAQASQSATPPERPSAAAATPPARDANTSSPIRAAQDDPNVVARIVDFVVTKDELKRRCLQELRPQSEEFTRPAEPITTEGVLLALIADKAMMIEGRRLGYLNDPTLSPYVQKHRRDRLNSALLNDFVRENLPNSDAEIDKMLQGNAKLSREQARMLVERPKAMALVEQFRKQLWEKFHVRHVKENFAKASEIHERLLNKPAKPRRIGWIETNQVRDDLSDEEKGLVLATFDGGQVTVQNWLETLCDIVPPRRPRNLNTPEGVGLLVDGTVGPLVLVLEAKARGYDKDPEYLAQMKEFEDQNLLWKVQDVKTRDIAEPNEEQIKAFFETHQEWFAQTATLKVDQVWCRDLATAREVKAKLDAGEDVQAVRKAYSLEQIDTPFYLVSPNSEGIFWNELWKGEPNQVIGPVKGLQVDGVRLRVVKILEKTPAKPRPYSEQIAAPVKWALTAERRKAALDSYGKELRDKYGYELYAERIQGIDPLEVVTGEIKR